MNRINILRHKGLLVLMSMSIGNAAFAEFDPVNPPEPFLGNVVTVDVDPAGVANVSGAGTFQVGSTVPLQTWSPKANYHFQYWTLNGSVFSTATHCNYCVGDSVAHFVAHYLYISPDTIPYNPNNPPEPYLSQHVDVLIEPTDAGYVSGGGAFVEGTNTQIRVLPTSDYALDYWTANGYPLMQQNESFNYTVGDSVVVFVAQMIRRQPISVTTFPRAAGTSVMQTTDGQIMTSDKLVPNTALTFSTTGNPDYVFRGWQLNGQGYSTQTTCSYVVGDTAASFVAVYDYIGTGDTTLFNPESPIEPSLYQTVQITVLSADSSRGNVTGSGTFYFAALDTLVATPQQGFVFLHWQDGDTSAVRVVTAEKDTVFKAWFGNDTIDISPVICYQDTFFVADTALTQTGYYEFLAMGRSNLMALYRIHLTVLPYKQSEYTVEICDDDTFFIDTIPFTKTGNYTQVVQDEYGCDSTVILHLTVHPTYNKVFTISICEGERYSSYHFDADSTGIYTQYLKSVHGCDSTVILDLTVHPNYDTLFEARVCKYEPYTEHGFNVDKSITSIVGEHLITNNLQSVFGCDSIIRLKLTVDSMTIVHHYDTICQGDSLVWGTQVVKTAGDWYYQEPDPNAGCGAIDHALHLYVHPALVMNFSTDLNELCQGESQSIAITYNTIQGNPVRYDVIFDSKYNKMGLISLANLPLPDNDNHIYLTLPDTLWPGIYPFNVIVHDAYCYDFATDTLRFALQYNADSLITQRWNDLLSVRKTAYDRYGGFIDYQWYKDGVLLNGETSTQLYLPENGLDKNAEYAVAVTRTLDGVRVLSCGFTPDNEPKTLTFSVWPSLMNTNVRQKLHVRSSETGHVNVYDAQGNLFNLLVHPSGDIQMDAPTVPGVYFVHFLTESKDTYVQKFIVK